MSCGIIAHEAKMLPDYFAIVKRAFDNLPDALKPTTKTDTKYAYEFVDRFDGAPLDSSIYVATQIRGRTVQNLHITERAYIKDQEGLKTGSKQAVPLTGRISEETTANGFNEFYSDFMDSWTNKKPGDQDYRAYFYAWVQHPEYTLPGHIEERTKEELEIVDIAFREYGILVTDGQLLWRRWKLQELKTEIAGVGLSTVQKFKQEYPLTIQEAFQSGAGSVFDLEKVDGITPVIPLTEQQILSECQDKNRDEKYTKAAQDLLKMGANIWKLPLPGLEYVVGVDPSDGQGADFGVIDVWSRPTVTGAPYEQVAQFYGKLLPDDLALLTKEMATFYNRAFTGVENNMLSTILFLTKIYDNYFFSTKIDEKTTQKTKKVGWNTNIQTREKMIDDFLILFDDDLLVIRSARTIGEMRTFIKKLMSSGTYKREHADGKFDDALFAGMIAVQMNLLKRPEARIISQRPAGL